MEVVLRVCPRPKAPLYLETYEDAHSGTMLNQNLEKGVSRIFDLHFFAVNLEKQ